MPRWRKALLPAYVLTATICIAVLLGDVYTVQASSDPGVSTLRAVDIDDDCATLRGEIESDGNDEIIKYGFEWGTSRSNLSHHEWFYDDIDEGDDFEFELDDLEENETYYFRAYAKNDSGEDWGSIKSFRTGDEDDEEYYEDDIPLVITREASSVEEDQADINGEIEDEGDSDIEEFGFYLGIDPEELYAFPEFIGIPGEGEPYSFTITDLVEGITYYYKAYAKNDEGISYGGLRYFVSGSPDFTDDDIPLVITDEDVDVDGDEVTLNGEIEAVGGSDIQEYGFYYGTSPACNQKEVAGHRELETGDDFDCELDGLREATTYYYKAYAENNQGTSYGSVRFFNTDEDEDEDEDDDMSVTTGGSQAGEGCVTIMGEISEKDDSIIEEYGFYWGTGDPPMTKVKAGDDDIDEDETFSYDLTGLVNGTVYYYQAWIRHEDGSEEGDILSFTAGSSSSGGKGTASLTTSIGALTANGITVNGTISSTNGSVVREYGFLWGRVGQAESKIRLGSGILENTSFGYYIGGLEEDSTYYARSYAITASGTSYGPQIGFTASGGTVSPYLAAPTVWLTSPSNGISVARGAGVKISATASDAIGIVAMGLYVNGVQMTRVDGSKLDYLLDTAAISAGSCAIKVTAFNGTRASESNLTIYIDRETGAVSRAPGVNISSPADGFQLAAGGFTDVSARAASGRGVQAMGIYVDDVQKARFMGDSFTYRLESLGMAPGTHTIKVTAWDGVQVGQKEINVNV